MRTVAFKGREISYTLNRKQVKNINLRVNPDLSITVSANMNISEIKIDEFVVSKGNFILKSLDKFRSSLTLSTTPKKYISGESFNVLGNDVRLKVVSSTVNQVTYDGVFLQLETKNIEDSLKKEKHIKKWYQEQRTLVFNEVATSVYQNFIKHGVPYPTIRQRGMTSRWGSCLPRKGTIILNTKLFETPSICIEYVIMHEFCHFLVPNHSKAFYTLLGTMMPDWKQRKELLESRNYSMEHYNINENGV